MNVTKLRKFLGWCAVLNMSFLAVSWIYFLIAKDFGYIVLTDFFDLLVSYDVYHTMVLATVGIWKVLTFALFVIPYFAIKIVEKA